MLTGSTTPRKESVRVATTPRKDQRNATPRKMTPRKEPGNAISGREFRKEPKNTTPRREPKNATPIRGQSRGKATISEGALRRRVDFACDKKTQTVGETTYTKSRDECLRNEAVVVEGHGEGLSGEQVKANMNKAGCEDKMLTETAEEGIEVVEGPSDLDARTVEREKKFEDISGALVLREKQVEVREIQVKEKESDLAKSRQNIKNIKNIIDEKQLLARKLSDMERELQTERALRSEAESWNEEAKHDVQNIALRLEASLLQEGQEKSELMVQCHILGSQLQVLVKEVEMSRKTVEMLSMEVEKWRRMAQDCRVLNKDFSTKEAEELSLPTPGAQVSDCPLLEVNPSGKEVVDIREAEEMEVGVSGEAGRRKGEALDLLRIQEDEENPKSGSRMDFGEKKVFFQKKIEAEISSPSLRDRK